MNVEGAQEVPRWPEERLSSAGEQGRFMENTAGGQKYWDTGTE